MGRYYEVECQYCHAVNNIYLQEYEIVEEMNLTCGKCGNVSPITVSNLK